MTTQQILESVNTVFPEVGESQILIDLDDKQKEFANSTGELVAAGELSDLSTSVGWTLPSNFNGLYGEEPLRLYDSDGYPLYLGDYNYAYETQFDVFYIYSLTSTPLTGLSTGIDSAYIFYKRKPTTLIAATTALEIEEDFTKGLEHGLLADYFGKYPVDMYIGGQPAKMRDLNSAKWHQMRYEDYRIRAKRYANSKRSDSIPFVQNYQHAGRHQLPRRTKDATLGTTTITQLTSLGQIYDKFVLYDINTDDSGTITATLSTGYSTIAASKTGATLTITSTAEFGNDTFIVCNNGEASWEQSSSSLITVTLPDSFGDLSIEIYEYV